MNLKSVLVKQRPYCSLPTSERPRLDNKLFQNCQFQCRLKSVAIFAVVLLCFLVAGQVTGNKPGAALHRPPCWAKYCTEQAEYCYCSIMHSTILYCISCTIQLCTLQYCTKKNAHILLHCTILHCKIQGLKIFIDYYIVHCNNIQHCTVQYYNLQYHNVHYHKVLLRIGHRWWCWIGECTTAKTLVVVQDWLVCCGFDIVVGVGVVGMRPHYQGLWVTVGGLTLFIKVRTKLLWWCKISQCLSTRISVVVQDW